MIGKSQLLVCGAAMMTHFFRVVGISPATDHPVILKVSFAITLRAVHKKGIVKIV